MKKIILLLLASIFVISLTNHSHLNAAKHKHQDEKFAPDVVINVNRFFDFNCEEIFDLAYSNFRLECLCGFVFEGQRVAIHLKDNDSTLVVRTFDTNDKIKGTKTFYRLGGVDSHYYRAP